MRSLFLILFLFQSACYPGFSQTIPSENPSSSEWKLIDLLPGGHFRILKDVTNAYLQLGERRDTVSFVLPPGTVCWYYRVIAVPADTAHPGLKAPTLFEDLGKLESEKWCEDETEKVLTGLPQESLIDVYVFRNFSNASKFWKNHKFYAAWFVKKTRSIQKRINNPIEGRVWIGVQNRKMDHSIQLRVEAVAIFGWSTELRAGLKNRCLKSMLAQPGLGLNGDQTESLCDCYVKSLEEDYSAESLQKLSQEKEVVLLNDCLNSVLDQ